MKIGSNIIKMSSVALGLAAALSTAGLTHAAEWTAGDVTITLDSTFSIGAGMRTEDRDFGKISKSSLPNLDWTGYDMATNVVYQGEDIWSINENNGSYSANSDNGNLNFDKGDLFSLQVKGTHELNVSYQDLGLFVRGMYYYDFEAESGVSAYSHYLSDQLPSSNANDLCADPDASDNLCQDIRLLDAFVYADFYVGDIPVTIRVGDQVISWGESTFIQHGINNINPVNVASARAPGAELKEVFIPVGTLYTSVGLTDTVGVEAYYQYQWDRSILPVSGSYFATNDWAGDGGYRNNIQLSFTRNPDINSEFMLASLNALGDNIRSGLDPTTAASVLLSYATKAGLREYGGAFHHDADDKGQYGLKVSYLAEQLNDTEFGGYFINYHSKRPVFSGIGADYTSAGLTQGVQYLAANTITEQNITDIVAFPQAVAVYPEDIQLYGLSFNTNIGETSVAGEIAYRRDEPFQIDDVEVLYAAFPEQLAAAGLRPDLAGISQYDNLFGAPQPGDSLQGYITLDNVQAQATFTHLFGPSLGTDNLVLLAEVGYVQLRDMPDPEFLRLEVPGTHRTAGLEPLTDADGNIISTREGLHIALSDGPEVDQSFASESAWGYRLLGVADFNNVFSGVNLQVRGTFSHDVDGYTPNPMFLFFEGRKSSSVSFTFDYLAKLSATASYNTFWGGGAANGLSDRDFVSFNIKYSI